jgi:hypothetical protein
MNSRNPSFSLFFFFTVILPVTAYLYVSKDYTQIYNLLEETFPYLLLTTDNTPSLYLLSALAQSQAAIFAIAIGLNSIVLQMISTTYSSRLSYIFTTNSKSLWLFGGVSVFFDLLLIVALPKKLGLCSYFSVIMSLMFAIFVYWHIIQFIYKTTSLLNPSNVLKLVEENNSTNKNEQIFDIMRGSVENHDVASFKECLSKIYCSEILELCTPEGLAQLQDSKSTEKFELIISELIRAGKISAKLENDEVTTDVFEKINEAFRKSPIETKYERFLATIDKITDFLIYCSKHDLENSTVSGMHMLYGIVETIHTDVLVRTNFLKYLIDIGLFASEKKLEKLAISSVRNIEQLIELFIENNYGINRRQLLKIGIIGLYSAENKLVSSHSSIVG